MADKRRINMNQETLSLSLEESQGKAQSLGERISSSPYTALVFYRGDW